MVSALAGVDSLLRLAAYFFELVRETSHVCEPVEGLQQPPHHVYFLLRVSQLPGEQLSRLRIRRESQDRVRHKNEKDAPEDALLPAYSCLGGKVPLPLSRL